MREEYLVLEKTVDLSVLREGMSIPELYQPLFYEKLGRKLRHGESMDIVINLMGKDYPAQLINQAFSQERYPGHGDVLQIRYTRGSELAAGLKTVFASTWDYILQKQTEAANIISIGDKPGKRIIIPDERKEYIAVYTSPLKGCLVFDCITNTDYVRERKLICESGEIMYEMQVLQYDEQADIVISDSPHKIRRLSRAVGENLKKIYDYRCQICGAKIGESYGSELIHAHHIDYFTHSLNNNADNILIVCPNHHGIIHDKNPVFNRKTNTYSYPNGFVEGLELNLHLK